MEVFLLVVVYQVGKSNEWNIQIDFFCGQYMSLCFRFCGIKC